ncbi:hypothetical protein KYTH41_01190 [Helicobacter pylori]
MKTYSYNHFLFSCFILGAFLLGLLSPAYALSVITTKEIDANLPIWSDREQGGVRQEGV